jgi:O-antigen/teichoic acid export membrane protein
LSNTINIGRKDVLWNYAATFLQIGMGVILLPFILRVFPQETVAIWTIFTTIIAFSWLLDFGFTPSFARNVSYVVSGVKELKANGYNIVESHNSEVDYSLFKGLINAMRWVYACIAVIHLALLATAGTYYLHTVLKTYSGDHTEVYIAWAILVAINSYLLYTMYYDSLMQGKGLIKRSKQIQIVGQSVYLIVAVVLILLRFNLIAVVSAQALSIIIKRILAHRTIYTATFKQHIQSVKAQLRKEILKPIYPNAVKVGFTTICEFIVSRSSIIIGSLYLPLDEIGSYGVTIQIIMIIATLAAVYFGTYSPKIAQKRVQNDNISIKQFYLKSCMFMFCVFFIGGLILTIFGDSVFSLIDSQTPLLTKSFIIVALFTYYIEGNRGMSGWVLVSKNDVPFFKATLIAGVATLILLFIFLQYTDWGVWGMLLAPAIVQGIYNSWKWPMTVMKELNIKIR